MSILATVSKRVLLPLALVCVLVAVLQAAVAVNTSGNNGAGNASASNTVTWNFDAVGAGCTNCALLVQVLGSNAVDDVTSVTYAGTNAPIVARSGLGWRYNYSACLINPASGSNAIVVTSTSTHLLAGVAVSYSGVSACGATSNQVTTGTSITGSITTTTANSWVFAGAVSDGATTWSGTTNATLRGIYTGNTNPAVFDNNTAIAAGSYSMTISAGGSGDIGLVMVELIPAGGATPTPNNGMLLRGVGVHP